MPTNHSSAERDHSSPLAPQPDCLPLPLPAAAQLPPDSSPPPEDAPPRRNGKIPHLTREHRLALNAMLDEGLTYQVICCQMADRGVSLNIKNISEWYHGGYQDELKARERRQLMQSSQERLLEMSSTDNGPALSLAGLRIAVTQLSMEVSELSANTHRHAFETNPEQYLRMLNTLARLGRVLLVLQKYQDEIADKAAALQKLDINRELNDNEFDLLVKKMDQVFKVARPKKDPPPQPPPPSLPVPSHPHSAVTPPPQAPPPPTPLLEILPPNNPGEATPPPPIENPLPSSPIQNQKSKIDNAVQNALPAPRADPVGNRKSKI